MANGGIHIKLLSLLHGAAHASYRRAKYAESKDEVADLDEVTTYVAVCFGRMTRSQKASWNR